MSGHRIQPVSVAQSHLERWSARQPLPMRLATVWATYAPRARGAVPRWLGRRFGTRWNTTISTASGATMAVDSRNLDIYTTILRDGAWEPEIVAACLAAVRPRDTFFDVGANAGYMTLEVANQRRDAQVLAFEPQPRLAQLVATSAALSDLTNVLVFDSAIGEEDGSVDLFVPAHSVHASTVPADDHGVRVPCALWCLDTLVQSGACAMPDVIKIDVEGAELAVLKGGEETIRQAAPVLIFEANDHSARFGYGRLDLLNWLKPLGPYMFFSVGAHDLLAVSSERADEFSAHYHSVTV